METCVDMLMRNHKLVTDSSSEEPMSYSSIIRKQMGGDKNSVIKNVATGSFPPIYFITPEEKEKEEEVKNRTFSTLNKKTALSIKEIMQERREDDKKPFISW